jgi:hypothetical protein
MEISMKVKELKIDLSYDPIIPLSICLKRHRSIFKRNTCTYMFIITFSIAKQWISLGAQQLMNGERYMKLCHFHKNG